MAFTIVTLAVAVGAFMGIFSEATEGVAETDIYGYWEIELFIPADALGPAQINVTIGKISEDNYAQTQNLVTIKAPEL